MTVKEQLQKIDSLIETINKLIKDSKEFQEKTTIEVKKLESRVDKKFLPINLESDIISTIQSSISSTIAESLQGRYSPLGKLVEDVVIEHSQELKAIISDSFNEVIKLKEFKESIVTAFSHKVAKSIISNNDGLFEKVSNELKQDAIFKSKMSIAVSNVVEECLKGKN